MDKQLSSNTVTALRDLAREVGDARGLDADAREELFGHLEDKTIAYLTGDETLSEADAVLLARKHFDSSGSLLEDGSESSIPVRSAMFARRLAAMAVIDLALGITLASVLVAMAFVVAPIIAGRPRPYMDWSGMLWLGLPSMVVVLGAVCMFRTWRRGRNTDQPVWYLRWKRQTFVLVLGMLLAFRWWLPGRQDFLGLPRVSLDHLPSGFGLTGVLILGLPVLWAWIWVRWTAQTNRSVAALVAGGFTWYLLRFSSGAMDSLVGGVHPYHDVGIGRGPTWLFVTGAPILDALWRSCLTHLPLIVFVTIVYVLKDEVVRAVGTHRDAQRGMPWVMD